MPTTRLLDGLATAVVWLDTQLNVHYMNQAAEMLFDMSARQCLKQPFAELFLDLNGVNHQLSDVLAGGGSIAEHECSLVLRHGENKIVDYTVVSFAPEKSGGKRELLFEAKPVDRQVQILRAEQLSSQQHASQEVIRGLAHEIKNPLGGLRGAAQLLEAELETAELREYTKVIVREADRLRNMVDRLLGPNQLPNYQSQNLHRITERVWQLLEAESRGRVAIRRDYDPSIPDMLVDKDLLIQALLNIAGNALEALGINHEPATETKEQKATASQQELPYVLIRTRAARRINLAGKPCRLAAQIEIIDNGPGIAAADIQQIFYPMITNKAQGTGLGLPIAQAIIAQHGGAIDCESGGGKTKFTIRLPIRTADKTAAASQANGELAQQEHGDD